MTQSRALPPEAAKLLAEAAKVRDSPEDPNARRREIDDAIRKVRTKYPEYFKQEIIK